MTTTRLEDIRRRLGLASLVGFRASGCSPTTGLAIGVEKNGNDMPGMVKAGDAAFGAGKNGDGPNDPF